MNATILFVTGLAHNEHRPSLGLASDAFVLSQTRNEHVERLGA